MMDFNDVTPVPTPSTDGNREDIRANLLLRLESVLMVMFPAGKVKRGKFLVGGCDECCRRDCLSNSGLSRRRFCAR